MDHLNLPNKANYMDDEKLQIYREYKKLNGASGDTSRFPATLSLFVLGKTRAKLIRGPYQRRV